MERLLKTALIAGLFSMATCPAFAQISTTIGFEPPIAADGAQAANLYTSQGVRFPSRPVIDTHFGTQVLRQGSMRGSGLPNDPTTMLCEPLEIEFAPAMDVRRVGMTVINSHLRFYNVIAFAGSTQVDRYEYWPRRERPGGSPLPQQQRDVSLRADTGEGGITRVMVNPPDDCFDLMRIDDLTFETLGPITGIDPVDVPDTNSVYAAWFEVTQGVMSRLTRNDVGGNAPDTRLMALPSKRLSFVEGRDTAVRFFLNATERDALNYAAELRVAVTYKDGSRRIHQLEENTGGGALAPFVDRTTSAEQQRRDLYMRRARVDLTHDYVIPGRFLANAAEMRLTLRRPESGTAMSVIDVPFVGPYRQGLNFWRVQGRGPDAFVAGPPTRVNANLAVQFMRGLHPISGGVVFIENGVLVMGGDAAGNSQTGSCGTFLTALDGAVAGTAGAAAIPDVNHWTNMYMLQTTPTDCDGLGWYNTVGALTNQDFTIVSHELGHNIGLNHASGQHDEAADRETWPYFHGSIGTPDEVVDFDDGVFGAIMVIDTPGVDQISDWGEWTLTAIAPCQGGAGQVFPDCTVPDDRLVAHDYMSYGPATNAAPFGNQTWISDINYHRLQQFYENCVVTDPPNRFNSGSTSTAVTTPCNATSSEGSGGSTGAAPSDALVFTGLVGDRGISNLQSIRKLAILPSLQGQKNQSSYQLILRDGQSKVLNTTPFTTRVSSGDAKEVSEAFTVIAPYNESIANIEIQRDGKALFSMERDTSTPQITLVSPKGGETWPDGVYEIEWQVSNAESLVYVQYSPDGGKHWFPLALVNGKEGGISGNTADLVPGDGILFYVSATSGLSSDVALTTKPVRTGKGSGGQGSKTPQPAALEEDCLPHDPEKLTVRRIDNRWKIVESDRWLMDFAGSEEEAKEALNVIKRFGFDQVCYIGRPDPSMTYLKAGGEVPGGSSAGLDCIAFDGDDVSVVHDGSRWILQSGRSRMNMFDREDEASDALAVIAAYGLNRQCFVGRPGPSFTYWLAE